jgi:hypothetical protein
MKNDFITVTPGKTYSMAVGGSMPKKTVLKKKKPLIKRSIKTSAAPALMPPNVKLVGKGTKMAGYGAGKKVGCGCGGAKMQQGGVVANTGSNMEASEFSGGQQGLFPSGAGSIKAPGIPKSEKANEQTAIGGAMDVNAFLKKLKMRRQAAGMNMNTPTAPITPEGINQYGSSKSGGSSVQLDSVGQKIFKDGGAVDDEESPSCGCAG